MDNIPRNKSTAVTVVPSIELDTIYRSGKVSKDVQGSFKRFMSNSVRTNEGMTLDQFIQSNRKIKIEMQRYLDSYKVQRSLMEAVIYYLRHPERASVRALDVIGGIFGKKLDLEAKKIANDPHAIRKLFEDMVSSIEHSRNKTVELEKHARALYNASLTQRDNIEKDITELLQKISINKDTLIKSEDNYNKIKGDMDKLLTYMREDLGMTIKGDKPVLSATDNLLAASPEETLKPIKDENNITNNITTPKDTDTTIPRDTTPKDTRMIDRKRIEAIKTYHAINDRLVDAENILRDATNDKLVLHQNYERAKENLTLYERVLINQVNEARNYFAILFAIYDAELKYTIPSARLIAHIASLHEVAIHLAQQIYDSRNIFNSLLDSVAQGALQIQEGIIMLAITPSWDYKVLEESENKTIELTRRTKEFTNEMDRRLLELETTYKDNKQLTEGSGELLRLDSGIDDNYLERLAGKTK